MGLFDSLFKSNTKGIFKTNNEANALLQKGRGEAEGYLGQARNDLTSGYGKAQSIYDTAAPALRSDLIAGFDGANNAIKTGYGAATGAIGQGRDDANERLDPFVKSGLGAQGLYDQALGVNGADSAKDFYQNYATNDPFRQFRDEQASRELERRYNAQGSFQGGADGGGSGRFATAAARGSLERGTQDLQTYMDRLERAGARGGQYAGQQGANSMTAGSQIGQLNAAEGNALANNATNQGSSLSQLGMNLADRRAGLATGQGGALAQNSGQFADLAYGNTQQIAANNINAENAAGQARARPGQNLIGLGGLAIGAMGGGMGGIGGALAKGGMSALSGLTGGYNAGSVNGLGGALASNNLGNVGQSSVGAGLSPLGAMAAPGSFGQMPQLGGGGQYTGQPGGAMVAPQGYGPTPQTTGYDWGSFAQQPQNLRSFGGR